MSVKFKDNLTTLSLRQPRQSITNANVREVLSHAYESIVPSAENIDLFGQKVAIKAPKGFSTSIEVIPSYDCNGACGYCIANMHSPSGKSLDDEALSSLTHRTIGEYKKNELDFDMRITGGEPFFHPERLKKLLETIAKNKVSFYRVNTNGSLLGRAGNLDMIRPFAENEPFVLDISRHHHDDALNNDSFGRKVPVAEDLAELNHKLRQKIMLRSILMKGYLDSLDKIKEFMEHFRSLGFNIFSFKNLVEFNPKSKPRGQEHQFVQANNVDFLGIVNNASRDNDFKFQNQILENDTVRELYDYKGSAVKFSFLDTEQAKILTEKERERGEIVLRKGVIFPDGRFSTGWDKEISTIYTHKP